MVAGNREDMTTIHALFAARDKITRTVKNLPNGAETLTECKDDEIAALIQAHVPAMDGRVRDNVPLPPMTFHPLFVELIKNADKVTLKDVATDHGVKVTYTSKDRYVVLLIQEHAKLVSRFIKNGMEEIHKPYTIPKLAAATSGAAAFMLGTDSAPHPTTAKYGPTAKAGVFNAAYGLEVVAEVFHQNGCLNQLAAFVSANGVACWGVEAPTRTITLTREAVDRDIATTFTTTNGDEVVLFGIEEAALWTVR